MGGYPASLDFTKTGGRHTAKFRTQAGLLPGVTDLTTAQNLAANGYNFYAAVATANQQFTYYRNGTVWRRTWASRRTSCRRSAA
jgi:hypothetical protein